MTNSPLAPKLPQQIERRGADFRVRCACGQARGLLELIARFHEFTARSEHLAQIQAPLRDAGLNAKRLPELLLPRGLLSRSPQNRREIVAHLRQFGIELD